MKKPFKSIYRIFQASLILWTILNLLGCTNPSQTTTEPDRIYLKFAVPETSLVGFQSLVQGFTAENPGIQIELVPLPAADWYDGNVASIASSADIFLLQGRAQIAAAAGVLLDLDPLAQSDKTFDEDDFWSDTLTGCRDAKGNLFGLPSSLTFYGLFLDKAMIANLPQGTPQPGWTLDDLQSLIDELAGRYPGQPVFMDATISANPALPGPALLAAVIDAATTNGLIDQAGLAYGLNWYIDLSRQNLIIPLTDLDDESQPAYSLDRRPALWIGTVDTRLLPESDEFAFNQYAFLPFPVADHSKGLAATTPVYPTCAVASAGTTQKAAAWAWIEYLSRHPVSMASDDAGYSIPARQSVTQGSGYWTSLPAELQPAIRFILDHAWYGSVSFQTAYQVGAALALAARSNESLQQALAVTSAEMSTTFPTQAATLVAVEPFQPSPTPPLGNQTIKFYTSLTDANKANWQALVDQFEAAYPSIQVNLPENPISLMADDPVDYLANSYDCFSWNSDDALIPQEEQALFDLAPFFTAEDPPLVNDFDPKILSAYQSGGSLIGLPASTELSLISYNADLLSKLGLPQPTSDWNFADFMATVNTVSATPGYYGFLFASWDIDFFLASQGVQLVDSPSPLAVNINTSDTRAAVQTLEDLVQSGRIFPLTGDRQNSIDAQSLVSSGKVAFWTSTSGSPQGWYFTQNGGPNFSVKIAPLPHTLLPLEQNTSANLGFFISKDSASPQACWLWLKYLSNHAGSSDGIPMRNSVRDSSAWETTVGPENAAVYRSAYQQTSFRHYNWNIYGRVENIFLLALQSIFQGGDIQAELAGAQASADQFLNCISPYAQDFTSPLDPAILNQCDGQ